jgi:hypothetical protein
VIGLLAERVSAEEPPMFADEHYEEARQAAD